MLAECFFLIAKLNNLIFHCYLRPMHRTPHTSSITTKRIYVNIRVQTFICYNKLLDTRIELK